MSQTVATLKPGTPQIACAHCGHPILNIYSRRVDAGELLWSGRFSAWGMIRWVVPLFVLTFVGPSILYFTQSRWSAAVRPQVAWLAMVAVLLAAWAMLLIVLKVRQLRCEYRIYSNSIQASRGILNIRVMSVNMLYVRDIELRQTLLEQIVGIGSIRIYSDRGEAASGGSTPDATDTGEYGLSLLLGIPDATEVYHILCLRWNIIKYNRGLVGPGFGGDEAMAAGGTDGAAEMMNAGFFG